MKSGTINDHANELKWQQKGEEAQLRNLNNPLPNKTPEPFENRKSEAWVLLRSQYVSNIDNLIAFHYSKNIPG